MVIVLFARLYFFEIAQKLFRLVVFSSSNRRQRIQRKIYLDLSNASFDANEADPLPSAGAHCARSKQSGGNSILFESGMRTALQTKSKINLHSRLRFPGFSGS